MVTEGEMLKSLRQSLGVNQAKFAQRLNTTQSAISMIESGSRRVGRDLAVAIKQEFGVDLWEVEAEAHPYQHLIDAATASLAKLDHKPLKATAKPIGELAEA